MVADLGLLALRLALGLVFLGHGTQKAFGAFGGPGFAGATGFIGSLGFRPARLWAALAVGGGGSEERRVGEEGRSRGSPYHLKKKKKKHEGSENEQKLREIEKKSTVAQRGSVPRWR